MKRVFIVHGWGENPDEPWLVWLAKELEMKGLKVIRPAMPESDSPNIEKWVSYLTEIVSIPDLETYFVGHSIGCQTILRYLQTINKPVGGAVFIAGWFSLKPKAMETGQDAQIAKPWLETPIDFLKVRTVLKEVFAIFSDDDYFVPVDNEKRYRDGLGAKTIILHGKGHFSDEDGVMDIPEVLSEVLRMTDQ